MLKLIKSSKFFMSTNEAGYSLIQIAIGMVVLGTFIAGAGHSFILYQKNKDIITTQNNIKEVAMAIRSFHQSFGFYPCAAPMDAPRNSAAYGQPTDCTDTSVSLGDCGGGICIEEAIDGSSYRIASGIFQTMDDRASVLVNNRVRLGAVPFRLLQIDEKKTYDAYGSRLLYAITESMGDTVTYQDLQGAIHVVNALGESLVDPQGSIPYIILSHGPNRIGGYTAQGTMTEECGGAVLDVENCRVFDSSMITIPPILPAMPPLAVFANDYRLEGGTVNNFDDVVEYFVELPAAQWRRTDTNIESIQTTIEDGVGLDFSTPTNALEVPNNMIAYDHDNNTVTPTRAHTGGLRATATVQAERYCEQDGTNCFETSELVGPNPAEITCTNPGEFMIGLRGDGAGGIEAECAEVRFYCTNNSFPVLTGVDASGNPICSAKPLNPCNGLNVQLCSGAPLASDLKHSNQLPHLNPISMPNSNHTAIVWATDPASYGVNPRKARFQCWNGVWQYYDQLSGMCNCNVPADTSPQLVNTACAGFSDSGNVAVTTMTWDPLTCSWTGGPATTDYSACNCPNPTAAPLPADNGTNYGCGAGYNSGTNLRTYTFNYANNVCNWEPGSANTCTCDVNVADGDGDGFRTTAVSTQCYNVAGFSGYTGLAYRIEQFNPAAGPPSPPNCSWGAFGWDTSACVCNREVWSHNVEKCDLVCEIRNAYEVWNKTYAPDGFGACVDGAPFKKSDAVCTPMTLKWTATSGTPLNAGNPASSPGSDPEVLSTCSCAQKKAGPGTCYDQIGPSQYYFYPCSCQ